MHRLVNDPALRATQGLRSREIARRDFSVQSVAQAHVEAYEIALAQRGVAIRGNDLLAKVA